MKNLKKLVIGGATAALALAPFLAFAQTPITVPVPTNTNGAPITSVGGIIALINKILFWVATVFWIAAAAFVFYAAFLYLTAAGDEEKVKKAGHQLLYAVVAIAVGIMAYGLPVLVNAFLSGS